MAKRINPKLNIAIAFALAIGLSLAVTLIVLGSRNTEDQDSSPTPTASGANPGTSSRPAAGSSSVTFPQVEGSSSALGELSGLVFPSDMSDFRSVVYTNEAQIDLTFKLPAAAVDGFINDSGLPAPTAGQRLLIHGSPLWGLNPEGDVTISSSEDDHGKVHRTVELIRAKAEPDAAVEVRVSLTPLP